MRVDESRILNPGLARHRITYRQKPDSGVRQNTFGEDSYTPEDVVTLRAQVKALSGRQLEAVRQVWNEAQYQITHHYYSGLTAKMQIAWGDKVLDILDIQDLPGTQRYLVVIAKEVV